MTLTSKDNGYIKIVPWLAFSVIALQNSPWFLWNSAYYVMTISIILMTIVLSRRFVSQSEKYSKNLFVIIISLLFFVVYNSLYQFRISSVMAWLAFVLMFSVTEREKIKTMELLTWYLSIVVGISFTAWIVNGYLFSLPQFGTLQMEKMGGEIIALNNYILFLEYDNEFIKRFYSVFDEPGVLGTMSALVLFINRYNFKDKRNVIIFIGGIFTFSIAYIILVAVGAIIVFSKTFFSIIKFIFFGSLVAFGGYYFLRDNATFQRAVLERSTDISASTKSRTSELMNEFFDRFIQSSDVIFGMGTSYIPENKHIFQGQGYQFFIVEYGVVGMVILCLMYISMINERRKLYIGLLFVFLLSFLQRPFLFTPWQLVLFSVGLASLKYTSMVTMRVRQRNK